ncbi:MAG: ABC transporter permease [Rikenellaceae bacterium]
MSVEYFIAKRSAEQKSGGKPSIMVRVATISVALSVALMVITLAIVFGFKREITASITGFTSEAILSDIATFNGSQRDPIIKNYLLEEFVLSTKGAESISPYATLQGVVRSSESIEGVMLRGVDSLYDTSFLASSLTAGSLPRTADVNCTRDLLLSASLAQRLGVKIGERIELIINDQSESMRRDIFKVCGLYSTGLDEWDRMVLITDIRNVQRLNDWRADQISGYELRFASLKAATAACEAINNQIVELDIDFVENIFAMTTEELYPSVFDWLKAHDVNALVVIIIMIIVAGFNMATALLIMVLERTKMIGVLKSLGMSNSSLQRIFLFRALRITLQGLAWGNTLSIGISLLQSRYHFIGLDAGNYMLRFVPIELGVGWIVALNMVVVAAILALMIIPTKMVSHVKIEQTLKFE